MRRVTVLILGLLCVGTNAVADSHKMRVDIKHVGADISPTMYGLFFEDINFAADGGLYAELVKNRSFDFDYPLIGWLPAGNVTVRSDGPFENNPNYVRLGGSGHPAKHTAITNEGFFGIGVKAGEGYRFSLYARAVEGASSLRVELIDESSMGEQQAFVRGNIDIDSNNWKKYTIELTSPITISKAKLRIFLTGVRSVDVEHISLFPKDTWKGRENGMRRDLVEALAEMKPGVFRFPGGCIVEGTDLETRYNWKHSVGAIENRKINENRWHYTFNTRLFPDYFQSYGIGFYEYFLLCEDIGAEPLPVVSCGLACQFQNGMEAHCSLDEIEEYVQDALDLIEFANGDITTTWGGVRAEMGHPEPFGMKYLAVGNEQWGEEYIDHLVPFIEAIRKAYPEIEIVGTSGPYAGGEYFDYLWPKMQELGADLVDEHFYSPESWFIDNADRYDNYSRKGPKVFAGEYACHGVGRKWNHFNASLLEAAFMTGLERNADIVRMATYAPLFAHVEGWQWRPDLIWYDNLSVARSCSYYVQQMYATNRGTHQLKLVDNSNRSYTGGEGQDGLYASAVLDRNDNSIVVKIVNISQEPREIDLVVEGMKRGESLKSAIVTTLHSDDIYADNVPHTGLEIRAETIKPITTRVEIKGENINVAIPQKSFVIYRIYR